MPRAFREIGGYLELERFRGEPYHKKAIALNSGRGCLSYLADLRGIEVVWVPDWMCGSVPDALRREGICVNTYPVNAAMLPEYEAFEVGKKEWMLLMDYYGQLTPRDVARASAFCEGSLVVDESQGFFRDPWENADTIYTCRKWFGVADGGYLATKDGTTLGKSLPRDESHSRMGHILGRFECSAGEFFAESQANEDCFDGEPAKMMSPITENILRAVDYKSVLERRNANWEFLHERLEEANAIDVRRPECAFMYPFYLPDGAQALRARLIARKIFIPTLWPNVPVECGPDSIAGKYAAGILPLPVDQRYGAEEMRMIAEAILEEGAFVR